ncbi:MAG: response regulator [Alphaproteobacteria bacterium]
MVTALKKPHILVVDDDFEIRELLQSFLQKHDFKVSIAKDGKELFSLLENKDIDLIVLDLMLPGESGLVITKRLREKSNLPIIMLTAVGEDVDKIVGLEMGVDDYMAKPFNPRELVARIRTVLRRTENQIAVFNDNSEKIPFANFKLDTSLRALIDNSGQRVDISSGDFDLLLAFAKNPKRVLSRDYLLDIAKGRDAQLFDRSIDIQISRLRRKIGDNPKKPSIIITVRGCGYMFNPSTDI